jgi:secretion/DNA translocation related TadE-like protein
VKGQRGTATLLVAAALGVAAMLAALSADLALAIRARAHAQTAADAAALAAAQELIVPTSLSPRQVAEEYASKHGAQVTECECDPARDDVVVTVTMPIHLPFFGSQRRVTGRARAVVEPEESSGLAPFFVAGLKCLFGKVSGISIVSGYRTREEQAALYEQKPGLAAPPGHSMHELGLAADLGFPSEASRVSAHDAAPSCGLTFPVSYEPWHIEPAVV